MKKRELFILAAVPFIAAGCGGGAGSSGGETVMEETGSIESGDITDDNHGGLAYDPYEFQVAPSDTVTVEIDTEGFDPMLKLIEGSTGAVLAEWDSRFTDVPCLVYTIAGGGTCQARVYALDNGTGPYTLRITVKHR